MSEIKRYRLNFGMLETVTPGWESSDDLIPAYTFDRLQQERDTLAQRVAWQPIETADQNAELLWLFDPTEGVAIGFWDFMDGYWRGVETSGLSGGRITPTHQAPLTMPDPPAPPVRD